MRERALLSAALRPRSVRSSTSRPNRSTGGYWINVHIPALRRWCFRDGRPRSIARAACVIVRRSRAWSGAFQSRRRRLFMAFRTGSNRLPGSYLAADSSPSTATSEPLDSRETDRKRVSGFGLLCSCIRVPEFAEYLNTRAHFPVI